MARSITSGTSCWPKEIVSLFSIPPAIAALRIVLAGAHAIEHLLHRPAHAAAPAHELAHRAVHLDHELRRVAGDLVQLVDVLRDERVQLASLLQSNQSKMTRVGPRRPGGARQPVLPRGSAHLGIGKVVVDVGKLLGERILRPHALRAAEVGDAGIGGNARAGQDDDALRRLDPVSDRRDLH